MDQKHHKPLAGHSGKVTAFLVSGKVPEPLFKKATVTFENGQKLVINAPSNSASNRYIQNMKLNNKNYTRNFLTVETLKKGATLDFDMTDTPDVTRGTSDTDAPYSFSKAMPANKGE